MPGAPTETPPRNAQARSGAPGAGPCVPGFFLLNTARPSSSVVTAAILLRRAEFSETSFIVTWCTERAGKLRTVARGARRPGNAFAGALDLFYLDEISVALARRSDLHALREAILIDPHEGLRRHYLRFRLAGYFCALIDRVAEPDHPAPELFELLRRALGYLQGADPDRATLLHYERRLGAALGLGAQTDAAERLVHAFGRLPAERDALLRDLPGLSASGPPGAS